MAKYKITHNRPECIGCAACVSVCPAFWEMGDDGKSNLKGSTKEGEKEVMDIEAKDHECNKNAADSCPVKIIGIKEIK